MKQTKKPENTTTHTKYKKDGSVLPAPSHAPGQHRSVPIGNSQLRNNFLGQQRESAVSNHHLHLSGQCTKNLLWFHPIQFSSVTQSCPTLCDPMDRSTPGLPVHHQLPQFTQIHVHWVGDAIQPSHPLSSPSPPVFSLSQHQGPFKWVSASHQVAYVLEFQSRDI